MAGPFDYTIQTFDPSAKFLTGVDQSFALQEAQRQRMAAEAQARAEAERQAQVQQVQRDFFANKNPSVMDVIKFSTTLPPEMVKSLNDQFSSLPKEAQSQELRFGGQVMSALMGGDGKVAKDVLFERAAAERNSGNEEKAKYLELIGQSAEISTERAGKMLAPVVAVIPGGKEMLEAAYAAQKAPFEMQKAKGEAATAGYGVRKTQADIANIESQIAERAARIGIDADRLQSEYQAKADELAQKGANLPESSQKVVNEAAMASTSASQSAGQMLSLADNLEKLAKQGSTGYGAASSMAEWWARSTGNQDALSMARGEYERVRNSAALKMLPPGPATDKDIALAMKGFPPETADAKYLAQFLRGMAKMSAREAAYENARSEWVNEVGFMGKPKRDIEVDGVKVAAGTTFPSFASKYLDTKAKSIVSDRMISGRGYMKHAGQ